VWKLDRAFRSLRHALDVLEEFEQRNIQFRSLTDQIDTTTPMGKEWARNNFPVWRPDLVRIRPFFNHTSSK